MDKHRDRVILLCPEFFEVRLNGIGRVAQAIRDSLSATGRKVVIWSANDPKTAETEGSDRAYGRRYLGMMLDATLRPRHRIALIACLHLGLSPVARMLAWRSSCPYFVFLHGIEAWRPLRKRSAWGLRKADLLIANSRYTLRRFHSTNPEMIQQPNSVVHLGTEVIERSAGFPRRRGQVLAVSRLTKADAYKNIRLLIEAFVLVVKELPWARLVVVGDGDDRRCVAEFATARLRKENCTFVGLVPDSSMKRIWSESSVFALPSVNEGFGLVFAEAMAYGLPCICSDLDAVREVIVDGATGFAITTANPQPLAEAICRLLADDTLRERMGEAGRTHCLSNFTAAQFSERLLVSMRGIGI